MTQLPEKLSAPARRALDGARLKSLEAVAKKREADVAALHGMGPKALGQLKAAMKEGRLKFTDAR